MRWPPCGMRRLVGAQQRGRRVAASTPTAGEVRRRRGVRARARVVGSARQIGCSGSGPNSEGPFRVVSGHAFGASAPGALSDDEASHQGSDFAQHPLGHSTDMPAGGQHSAPDAGVSGTVVVASREIARRLAWLTADPLIQIRVCLCGPGFCGVAQPHDQSRMPTVYARGAFTPHLTSHTPRLIGRDGAMASHEHAPQARSLPDVRPEMGVEGPDLGDVQFVLCRVRSPRRFRRPRPDPWDPLAANIGAGIVEHPPNPSLERLVSAEIMAAETSGNRHPIESSPQGRPKFCEPDSGRMSQPLLRPTCGQPSVPPRIDSSKAPIQLPSEVCAPQKAITSLGDRSRWEAALELLVRVGARQVRINEFLWGAAMRACERGHRWPVALRVFRDLQHGRLQPNIVVYNAAIHASGQLRQWEQALHMLDSISLQSLQPNPRTHNEALGAIARAWHWAASLRLLGELWPGRCSPDVVSYSTCVSACEKAREWMQAVDRCGGV